jgi:hypothetical protein
MVCDAHMHFCLLPFLAAVSGLLLYACGMRLPHAVWFFTMAAGTVPSLAVS